MTQKHSFEVELVCVDLPSYDPPELSELRLGIQARKDVVQDVLLPVDQVIFRFPISVAFDPAGGAPRFSGDYAHGPRGTEFIYLCWGAWEDGAWHGIRRAKLPLYVLTPEQVAAVLESGQPLRGRVHLTDAKGEPSAASLKPGVYEWMI